MLKTLNHSLEKLSSPAVVSLSLLLVGLLGSLAALIHQDLELDVLYLFPIALATWYGNRRLGSLVAGASVAAWLLSNRPFQDNPAVWGYHLWNALIELLFFGLAVGLLTLLKQRTRALERLASQDSLTEIANHRTFYTLAQQEIARACRYGETFTLAYLDVDNFKQINDTYGHRTGDELLQSVALTLRHNIRQMDTVARVGGDEYALLLPTTSPASARQVMEKIQTRLHEAMRAHHWPTTFSLGVVTFMHPPASVDEMIHSADQVMYAVKRQGKSNMAFEVWPASAAQS